MKFKVGDKVFQIKPYTRGLSEKLDYKPATVVRIENIGSRLGIHFQFEGHEYPVWDWKEVFEEHYAHVSKLAIVLYI